MDSRLKQRLIGAAVLWVLAFIFLPPLLQSPPGRRKVQMQISVPQQAGSPQPGQTRDIQLNGGGPSGSTGAGASAGPARGGTGQAGPAAESGGVPSEVQPAPQPARGPAPEPKAASADSSAAPRHQAVSGAAGWAVQVGSFSKKGNAVALEHRLRERQYPVMVMPFRLEGETLYRVRVGPEPSKAAAQKRRDQLAQQMDLNGRVVSQGQ